MESSQRSYLLNGQEPPMGLECSGLFVLQFYENGQITDPANIIYLKLDGAWYRIFFEASIVFWRQDAAPAPPTNSDFERGLLLNDLTDCAAIVGHVLVSAHYNETHHGVCTELRFSSGSIIALEYRLATDSTTIGLVS
jgi:hypothetical protein